MSDIRPSESSDVVQNLANLLEFSARVSNDGGAEGFADYTESLDVLADTMDMLTTYVGCLEHGVSILNLEGGYSEAAMRNIVVSVSRIMRHMQLLERLTDSMLLEASNVEPTLADGQTLLDRVDGVVERIESESTVGTQNHI